MKLSNLDERLSKAISFYWKTRENQKLKQKVLGVSDQGARSAVTGGAQMNGIISLISEIICENGIDRDYIYYNKSLELPGFFRPTKEWDILVVKSGQLLMALEAKSQVGPSFGNNFNNRTEEALGSSLDLWTAFRENAFNSTVKPWLGYFFMLEDCEGSRRPVKVKEPHFPVFPEFKDISYSRRYELFCRKLIRERHYTASSFILSSRSSGIKGKYQEPANDLSFRLFVRSLISQILAYGDM